MAANDKAAVADAPQQSPVIQRDPNRKAVPPLGIDRFKGSEFERAIHIITSDEGTIVADIINPDYWGNVADRMKAWDRIEARANDGTWFAELLVLDVSRAWARVHVLAVHQLSDYDVSQSQAAAQMPYFVKHNGPHDKWVVIRKSDGQVLTREHGTAGAAQRWMDERLKAG